MAVWHRAMATTSAAPLKPTTENELGNKEPALDGWWEGPPPTWEEMEELIETNQIAKLGRDRDMLDEYRLHMATVKTHYRSVADYVRHKVFACPLAQAEDGRLKADFTPDMLSCGAARLVPNDYPYVRPLGSQQLLLWSTQPLPLERVRGLIASHTPADTKAIIFVNIPRKQSIPELFHAHVLLHPACPGLQLTLAITDGDKEAQQ